MSDIKKIALDGFWKQNPGVVQLLGLCPTLAVKKIPFENKTEKMLWLN